MNRIFGALLLGAFLTVPSVIMADDKDHPQKYYDRDHKDYHEWNDGENASYHHFLEEKHYKEHEFHKASKREQRDYWKWRHDHLDAR